MREPFGEHEDLVVEVARPHQHGRQRAPTDVRGSNLPLANATARAFPLAR
ncbi:hypothetical protein [Nannocystis bainbridge]|uniref:Uncharacterized protein n=1 Tax=Nannocystis bainbridge TaxID=2995303 RepID=A0ABT5EAA0_9BACT|nr:hypothetical protein [Nannocystis bainbridge]MDC0722783.1 hypothetical protein [Nannocystis bainbridge]